MSVHIERGYEFRITPAGVELDVAGAAAAWTLPSLAAEFNDGAGHFLVADFENEGGAVWRLRTSVDGAPFADQGTASGPPIAAADTEPSISLSDAAADAWADEVVMWVGHARFTDEQLANLHALAASHGLPMSEYTSQFPARASGAAAQVEWVAPNRRTASAAAQVEWVAPARRAASAGLSFDYWSPPLAGPNLLVNPGAEAGDATGWISSQSEPGDGPFEVRGAVPDPYAGSFYFAAGASGGAGGATKTLSQEVDLLLAGFSPSSLDGSPLVEFGGWQASLFGDDTGRIELEFLDGPGGAVIGSRGLGDLAPIGWTERRHVVRVPSGTRAVRFAFTGTKVSGGDIDSYLDGARLVLDASTTTAPPTTTTLPPTTTTLPPATTLPPTTTVPPYLGQHPADAGPNFRISPTEALTYAGVWLTGGTLEFQGVPLTGPGTAQAYILRAAAIMLANFQARYEDAGTAAPIDSPAHAQRWQELPDL